MVAVSENRSATALHPWVGRVGINEHFAFQFRAAFRAICVVHQAILVHGRLFEADAVFRFNADRSIGDWPVPTVDRETVWESAVAAKTRGKRGSKGCKTKSIPQIRGPRQLPLGARLHVAAR